MKKHLLWLVIILVIQTGALYGVNSYFHVDDITVAAPIPPVSNQDADKEPEEDKGEVRLAGVSFDKQYYAVAYSKKVEIYKPNESDAVFSVDVPDGMYVSLMQWLPDESRLLYALANFSRAKNGRIEVHVVDVASGKGSLVKDLNKLSKGSHVKNFALSTYTNLLYLNVETKAKNNYVYQINIMKRMQRISLPTSKIGNVALASKEDILFYEDKVRRQIYSYDGKKVKMITPDDWDYCLLGITKDDKLYIGRLNDGKVISIFKADKDGTMDLFADLSSEIPRENIFLGLKDQLVLKDFPTAKYIAVLRQNGDTKTYGKNYSEAIITGDAMFYMKDGAMHMNYLE